MKACTKSFLAAAAAASLAPSFASAVVVYSETFETNQTANWNFNSSQTGDAAADGANQEANFFFDYSTIGIPQAPNSPVGAARRGIKMEANVPDGTGTFAGMSVSPKNVGFTGDLILRYDLWQNFNGPFPGGGSGSTQITGGGIGTSGTTAQFPGGATTAANLQGVYFGSSGDGGSGQDYRAYTAIGAPAADDSGVYAAGTSTSTGDSTNSTNNGNAYYGPTGAGFGSQFAPGDQFDLFSQQSNATAPGSQGMEWHRVEITKTGNIVTWEIDNVLIATVNVATKLNTSGDFVNGNDIFFGQFDVNGILSTDPNARALLFGLVDNVEVEGTLIPEPSVLALLGLGGLGMLRRRRAI